MQATHDLLQCLPLGSFDHLEFPGVVPRTFLGAFVVSVVVLPLHYLLTALLGVTKMVSQYLIRIVLGTLLWASFVYFASALNRKFGHTRGIGDKFLYLSALQFHVPFYMSRTLPNTFALAGCLAAYASWLDHNPVRCLCIMAFFMITFRCDILVILAPLTLQMLIAKEISFFNTLTQGIRTAAYTLVLTTAVDSFFWQRWVWPEGIVLFYNTVENNSSNWGVMQWHWYVTSALPRALNVSAAFAIFGLAKTFFMTSFRLDRDSLVICYYAIPAISSICLYSFLPHKELRFIFPALPLLTAVGAKGWDTLCDVRGKQGTGGPKSGDTLINVLAKALRMALLTLGGCFFLVFLLPSIYNYPGGMALSKFHRNYARRAAKMCSASDTCAVDGRTFNVHIDAGAAMTGVTRFGQIQPRRSGISIEYSKEEGLPATKASYRKFDWLIHTDASASHLSEFKVVEEIEAFDTMELNLKGAWTSLVGMLTGEICPVRIGLLSPLILRKKTKAWILQRSKLNL